MKNTFNADFYVVTATVIPVLYLALTLQGSTYEKMLASWERAFHSDATKRSIKRKVTLVTVSIAVTFAGCGILAAGILGEAFSILALADRHMDSGNMDRIFGSVIILIVAAAAGPFYRIVMAGASISTQLEYEVSIARKARLHSNDDSSGD